MPNPHRVVSLLGTVAGNPVRSYRRTPAAIRLLCAGIFINRSGGFIISFLALFLALRDFRADEIGIALVASGIGGIAGASLSGMLMPRLGTRWTLFLAMTSSGMFTVALIPTTSFPVTMIIVAAISIVNRAYVPVSATMVGDLSRPEQRVQMYAIYQLSLNTGSVVGPAIAGFLLTHSITALLIGDAATSVAFGLIGLRIPVDGRQRPAVDRAARGRRPRQIWNDWRYLLFCAAVGLVFVVYKQAAGPLSLIFKDHHYDLQMLGYLFGASGIAGILFLLPLSHLARRFPLWLPLTIGALLIGGAYTVLLVAFSFPFLIVNFSMWTLGDMILCPLAMVVATMMSTAGGHGPYQAAYSVARTTGIVIGPAVGVFVLTAGAPFVWWGATAVGAVAAVMFYVALHHLPKPEDDDRVAGSKGAGCSSAISARKGPDDLERSAA